jgi:hypothetical protein
VKVDRQAIQDYATKLKRPIETLIVLSRLNDPFYLGDARMRDAEWFAALYREHGFSRGVHIRRIHYRLISQEEQVRLPDGSNYENTERCYDTLGRAAQSACYAGLVDAGDFIDQRNPEPTLFLADPVDEPSVNVSGVSEFSIRSPSIDVSISPGHVPDGIPDLGLLVSAECPAPYHVEIWCEKSTIDDILGPLARQYGLNVQTAVGEISTTICRELVERAGKRPVRIIYVSDFDPAGQSMPVAAARKIEFFARERDEPIDKKKSR